jgi:hypothetical protein
MMALDEGNISGMIEIIGRNTNDVLGQIIHKFMYPEKKTFIFVVLVVFSEKAFSVISLNITVASRLARPCKSFMGNRMGSSKIKH